MGDLNSPLTSLTNYLIGNSYLFRKLYNRYIDRVPYTRTNENLESLKAVLEYDGRNYNTIASIGGSGDQLFIMCAFGDVKGIDCRDSQLRFIERRIKADNIDSFFEDRFIDLKSMNGKMRERAINEDKSNYELLSSMYDEISDSRQRISLLGCDIFKYADENPKQFDFLYLSNALFSEINDEEDRYDAFLSAARCLKPHGLLYSMGYEKNIYPNLDCLEINKELTEIARSRNKFDLIPTVFTKLDK